MSADLRRDGGGDRLSRLSRLRTGDLDFCSRIGERDLLLGGDVHLSLSLVLSLSLSLVLSLSLSLVLSLSLSLVLSLSLSLVLSLSLSLHILRGGEGECPLKGGGENLSKRPEG